MKWLTPPQVAERLAIDEGKVRTWIASGELVAVNVAEKLDSRPRWRISQEELDKFLQRRRAIAVVPRKRRRKVQPNEMSFIT